MRIQLSLACILLLVFILVCGCGQEAPPEGEPDPDRKQSGGTAAEHKVVDIDDKLGIDESTGFLIAKIRDVDNPSAYGKEIYGVQGIEYRLPLAVKLPVPVLHISEGNLERAITDKGKSILLDRNRTIYFFELKNDQMTTEFTVAVGPPDTTRGLIEEMVSSYLLQRPG